MIIKNYKPLLKIYNCRLLAEKLRYNYIKLVSLAIAPNYYTFCVPKKQGGQREICSPNEDLKLLQKTINIQLQNVYKHMDISCVYGFNRSQPDHIKANAQNHINKKYIFNTDIKSFFPDITSVMVRDIFMAKPFFYDSKVATFMALLTTYNNLLPTGSPSSPIISNFIFYQTDLQLKEFAITNNLSYSRYADDLTFSSDTEITPQLISNIYSIIERNGFIINLKKSRLQNLHNRQIVTGLTVNKKVNINRLYIRKIRAILHDIEKRGVNNAAKRFLEKEEYSSCKTNYFLQIIRGRISFIGFIRGKEDDIYKNFIQRLNIASVKE